MAKLSGNPQKVSKTRKTCSLFRSFTRALRGSILHSPQGTQGGDLGLGQPSNPAAIESLERSVTPQRLQMLVALKIPHLNGIVIAATGQHTPIRAPDHSLHIARMPRERAQQASGRFTCQNKAA